MLCPCARVAGGFVRGLVASCAASWERTGVALVVARARERAALGRERRERRDVAIARGQENLQSNRSAVKPRSNRSAVKPRAHRSAVKPRAGAGSRCSVRTRRGMHLGVVLLCRKRGPALLVAQRGHAGVRSVLGRGSRRLYRLRTKQRGVRGARGGSGRRLGPALARGADAGAGAGAGAVPPCRPRRRCRRAPGPEAGRYSPRPPPPRLGCSLPPRGPPRGASSARGARSGRSRTSTRRPLCATVASALRARGEGSGRRATGAMLEAQGVKTGPQHGRRAAAGGGCRTR
jgi:hypothetical protein